MSRVSIFISYILFSLLFQKICSNIFINFDVKYLKVFELKRNNILACTEKGIYLYNNITDSNATILKNFERDIDREEFDFLTIEQFEVGEKYIIALYKDMVFIFQEDGQLLTEKEVHFESGGKYYALVPYEINIYENNSYNYSFFVGFLKGSTEFLINLLSFNNTSFEINKGNDISLSLSNYTSISSEQGFSCQIMNSKKHNKVLTCFFRHSSQLAIESYNLTDFHPIYDLSYKTDNAHNPILIHSVVSVDKTESLICYLKDWNKARCDKYNINDNKLMNLLEDKIDCSCINYNPSVSMIYTSTEKDKFIYTCMGYNNYYNLYQFNSDFELEVTVNNKKFIVNDCEALVYTLIGSKINEKEFTLISSCKDKGLVYNKLPDDIQFNNNPTSHSMTEKNIILSTLTIETEKSEISTALPSLTEKTIISTTSLSMETESNLPISLTTDPKKNDIPVSILIETEKDIISSSLSMESENISFPISLTSDIQENILIETSLPVGTDNNLIKTSLIIDTKNNIFTSSISNMKSEKDLIQIDSQNLTQEQSYVNNFFKNKFNISFINEEEKYNFKIDIINSIQNGSLSELIYDIIKSENNLIIKNDREIYQISTLINQDKIENLTYIDLKDCENEIREKYKIKDEILIFKIEHKIKGYNIPIVEYTLFLENGTLINLNICNNIYSKYLIPVSINEDNIYQYDPSSDYYKDECMKLTSEEGTDLTLYDRKNDYNEKNMSLCEINCTLKYYDSNASKVICDCKIKSNLLTYNDLTQSNLLNKIDNSESKTNLNIMKCYNSITSEDIKTNSGFYIIFIIIMLFIIIMIIFCFKGYRQLEDRIDEVIHKKFKNDIKRKTDKIKNIQRININSNRKKRSKTHKETTKSKIKLMNNTTNEIMNK